MTNVSSSASAFVDGRDVATDLHVQRALQHVNHLFVSVRMQRHERASFEVRLHEGLLRADDRLTGNHFCHFVEWQLVPPIERDATGHLKVQRSIIDRLPGRRNSGHGFHA